MSVEPATSAAPARWLLGTAAWWDLVRFGPPGFDRYVRIRFEARVEGSPLPPWPEDEQPALRQVLDLLAGHTSTPEHAYAAVWEGWTSSADPPSAPLVPIPNRTMLLFVGPVSALRDAPATAWGQRGHALQEPHLVWPEDRAWMVACEVDEEIAFTVACADTSAEDLLAAFGPGAQVVEYAADVPLYRE